MNENIKEIWQTVIIACVVVIIITPLVSMFSGCMERHDKHMQEREMAKYGVFSESYIEKDVEQDSE